MGTKNLKKLGLSIAAALGTGGAVQASAQCAPAAAPVLSLSIDSRYEGSDSNRATINTETQAETKETLKPLDDFLRDLADSVEKMLESSEDLRPDIADCMLQNFLVWAEADALSALGTPTAQMTIGARLASLSLSLRQAARYATDTQALAVSADWLSRRIKEQMLYWEVAPKGAASGNLRAWAALAATATAELTQDQIMQAWAIWSTSYVLCSANPDGSLPQEMTRGKFALHYQLYALSPLATSVALLEQQGITVASQCDTALKRAVHFALSDLETGERTQEITGQVQTFFDGSAELSKYHLAWLEPYLVLGPDPVAEDVAASQRPLSFSKLGGNQTLIWAQ